jgi:hypothetical protein
MDDDGSRTVTVHREIGRGLYVDVTVGVETDGRGGWRLQFAADEEGGDVELTKEEWYDVLLRVRAGHDETGR